MADPTKSFRSGLAVLIGRTNAGKSTLLNALVGAKVSIVTFRPQTTREPVQGVVHRSQGQIAFVDTPGFFKTHRSRLVDLLHERARQALAGIDVVVHVADPTRAIGEEDEMVTAVLAGVTQPRILCLNKCDLRTRPFRKAWIERGKAYADVVEVSGRENRHLHKLVNAILRHLPVGEPLYPLADVTNATREFQAAELIREKVYLLTGDEVPYRTSVELHGLKESVDKSGRPVLAITGSVLTANERYQRMLIGVGGHKIREICAAAHRELETHFGRKVSLDLDVMVDTRMVV